MRSRRLEKGSFIRDCKEVIYIIMTRIAILGATGYTALELIKILLRHPGAEIVAVTSRQEGQPPIAMIHPSLTDRLDLRLEDLAPAEIAARAECVFSCLPHGASSAVIPHLLAAGTRVVDFSADYRLNDRGSLRPVVRTETHRPRAVGQGRVRPAGTVSGPDSLGPTRGQPGLLPHHGDSRLVALVEGRPDRDRPTSSSMPRAASAAQAGRPSSRRSTPSATRASRPTTSAATATRPRSTSSSPGRPASPWK